MHIYICIYVCIYIYMCVCACITYSDNNDDITNNKSKNNGDQYLLNVYVYIYIVWTREVKEFDFNDSRFIDVSFPPTPNSLGEAKLGKLFITQDPSAQLLSCKPLEGDFKGPFEGNHFSYKPLEGDFKGSFKGNCFEAVWGLGGIQHFIVHKRKGASANKAP